MGTFSIWHWLIVLLIVMLVFGTKKLRNMGADLGGAVKGFKEGMRSDDERPETQQQVTGHTIDAEVKKEESNKV